MRYGVGLVGGCVCARAHHGRLVPIQSTDDSALRKTSVVDVSLVGGTAMV